MWQDYVAVGFSDAVHLVRLPDLAAKSVRLPGYFGYLHLLEDRLLVASAEDVRCFATNAALLWTSEKLGIDGVIIDDVRGGEVVGNGEWDPPGGWLKFRIDLTSGKTIP